MVSRIMIVVVSILSLILAMDPNSMILTIVSYAWAGFGSAFGPLVILSLYWRRMTTKGAFAGIVVGGSTVLIWKTSLLPRAFMKSSPVSSFPLLPLLW